MDFIKKIFPQNGFLNVGGVVVGLSVGAGGIWIIKYIYNSYKAQSHYNQKLEKWKESPQDFVILHTIPKGKTVPNVSPFAMKFETHLRMANIPYQMDYEYPFSPTKGKTPWITLNGEHLSDSQLIIEFLAKKYNKTFGNYNNEQSGIARAVRIMMDEHFYWGLGLWRYVYSEGVGLSSIFSSSSMPPSALKEFYIRTNARVKSASWAQGIGRHSQPEVIQIMKQNLIALSSILGKKRYLLGDEPCEEDSSVFGFLSQVIWASLGSPYQKLVKEELTNLMQYSILMKENFWPDWERCLAGSAL